MSSHYIDALAKLRKRNGELMTALQESAPHRVGPDGEIVPLEKVALQKDGMRRAAEPCRMCGCPPWEEPVRRGRMPVVCPECRVLAQEMNGNV